MKTTKYILLIFLLGCSTQFMATPFSPVATKYSLENEMKVFSTYEVTATPSTRFESTSAMELSGSALSSNTSAIGSDNPNSNGMSGPRRIGGGNNSGQGGDEGLDNPDDVYKDPVGDAVIPLLLLAVGYSIYLRRKNSVRTSDSGHQQ